MVGHKLTGRKYVRFIEHTAEGGGGPHENGAVVEDVQFWPIRPTAVRSLRPGDKIAAPVGPGQTVRGTVTGFEDHEESRIITILATLDNGEPCAKKCRPWDTVDRMVQPGEASPGSESRMVHGEDLWKWLNVDMNDPEGSPEKYVLKTFRRVHSDDTDSEAIEVKMQSKRDPRKVRILTLKPKATIGFKGHR